MKLNFRQGIATYPQTGAFQSFLQAAGGYVSLLTGGTGVIVTFAHQQTNYLLEETVDVVNAWGPLATGTEYFLYWDIDLKTGQRTFGATTIEPVFGDVRPPYIAGQHWFDTTTTTMKLGVDGIYRDVVRVFAAAVIGSSFIPLGFGFPTRPFAGSQVEISGVDAPAGKIILDDQGSPIRRTNGTLFTTEDNIFIEKSRINTVRLDATASVGKAMESIGQYQIVKFTQFGEISLANYDDSQVELIAMSMQGLVYGDTGSVVFQGVVENPNWNWQNVGAQLWISASGLLTETDPHVANGVAFPVGKPPVARVITPTTIYFEQGLGGKGDTGASGTGTGGSVDYLSHGNDLGGPVTKLDFNGPGIAASRVDDTVTVYVPPIPSPITFFDEGIQLGQPTVQQLDFAGNVTASRVGNRVTVTVPPPSLQWQEDGSNVGTPDATTINFTGQVDLTRVGNTISINVPATPLQWQDEGNNLGLPNISTVNIVGEGISGTRVGNTLLLASVPLNHNNLLNLQGGNVTERYHMSASEYTTLGNMILNYNTAIPGGGWATKAYVDANPWKYPVRVATTGSISLSGIQTIDGVLLQVGDLILVKNQGGVPAHVQNGVYVVATGAWTRSSVILKNGVVFYVAEGASNATQAFVLSTVDPIATGTTAIRFISFNNSQFIVVSGDATGVGTTSIPLTLSNSGVAAGTYTQVTVDTKGRVIAATVPSTLAAYGITDAVPRSGGSMTGYLVLPGDPISGLQAATKQYVDTVAGGTGFTVGGGLSLIGTVLSVASANTSRIVVNPTSIDLATTGVTGGTYNQVTVDAYGRVTSAANVGGGTLTFSGDVSGSGTTNITLSLSNTGVTAGTYKSVTVDAKGRVTGATNPTTLSGYGITDAVARSGSTMTGALIMGTSDTVSASNSAIQRVRDPVNAQDVATKAYVDLQTGSVSFSGGNGILISSGVISTRATARFAYASGQLDLSTTGVSAGTYSSVTVDVYGRVVSASNPTPVNQLITLSGDISGSGTSTIVTSLANTGVTPGANFNKVSVDNKGRVTAASTQTTFAGLGLNDGLGSLNDVSLTSLAASQVLSYNGTTWTNSAPAVGADQKVGIRSTDTNPSYLNDKIAFSPNFTKTILNPSGNEQISIDIAAAGPGAGGPFNTVYLDNYGRVVSASNTSGTNQNITVTGDATGSGTTAITLTLVNSGVTASTYRSVTVNSKGLVTGGTNPTTLSGYGITDAQPFSSYLSALNGTGTGIQVKTGSSSAVARAISGSAGRITVANGDGLSGNPTIDLASGLVTAGIYTKVTVDTYGRVTNGGTIAAADIGGLGGMATQDGSNVTITGGTMSGVSIAPRINTVTYSASIILDWSTSDVIRITLGGNATITNTGGVAGQKYLLEITQGGAGGHTVAFTGETVFGTDLTGITLSTGANLIDEIGFVYNEVGTCFRCVALTRGFST